MRKDSAWVKQTDPYRASHVLMWVDRSVWAMPIILIPRRLKYLWSIYFWCTIRVYLDSPDMADGLAAEATIAQWIALSDYLATSLTIRVKNRLPCLCLFDRHLSHNLIHLLKHAVSSSVRFKYIDWRRRTWAVSKLFNSTHRSSDEFGEVAGWDWWWCSLTWDVPSSDYYMGQIVTPIADWYSWLQPRLVLSRNLELKIGSILAWW